MPIYGLAYVEFQSKVHFYSATARAVFTRDMHHFRDKRLATANANISCRRNKTCLHDKK